MNLSEIGQKLLAEKQIHVQQMVVNGTFPLPPNELIYIITQYAINNQNNIRDDCVKTLQKFPKHLVKTFLSLRDIDQHTLFFLSYIFQNDLEILRDILLHPNVPEKVFLIFSKIPNEDILKILIENEEKWAKNQQIVTNLLNNSALPKEFVDKVSFHMKDNLQSIETEIQEEENVTTNKMSIQRSSVDVGKDYKTHFIDEVAENDEEKKRSIAGKISKMGVAEKIKLATLGNKEVRGILIKDTNKLVSTAVLKNPRITEGEIVKFSQDRNLPDDIIRLIANDRNWTQNYNVKLNLVLNPKTPVQISIKFLSSLGVKDLGSVAKSKNVPSQIATMARRIMVTRKN